jgi:hypothetical protein
MTLRFSQHIFYSNQFEYVKHACAFRIQIDLNKNKLMQSNFGAESTTPVFSPYFFSFFFTFDRNHASPVFCLYISVLVFLVLFFVLSIINSFLFRESRIVTACFGTSKSLKYRFGYHKLYFPS